MVAIFINPNFTPSNNCYNPARATVAQPAEQPLRKRRVKGSIPFGGLPLIDIILIVSVSLYEKPQEKPHFIVAVAINHLRYV